VATLALLALNLIFRICAQRYQFRALDKVIFPAGKAGNVLRGALGKLLWGSEYFARFFSPRHEGGPSGLADPPRPFVFRAAHLDGCAFERGEDFFFDLHIFDLRAPVAEALARVIPELANAGLGLGKSRVEFLADDSAPAIHSVDLRATEPGSEVTVVYRTPVDLKSAQLSSPSEIPFGVLFARVRDRVGTLSSLYGDGPLDIDYKSMGRRADLIRTVQCEIRYRNVSRRSGSTGDTHPIGGFTGMARYEGDLAEFMPYLRAAWWTGVGRHTAWGNGVIDCVAGK
jgi:hypothetical protein